MGFAHTAPTGNNTPIKQIVAIRGHKSEEIEMTLSPYLLDVAFGGLMVFILAMTAMGILTVYVPRLRANRTRIMMTGGGALLAMTGVVNATLARHPDNFWVGLFLAVMGSANLMQGIYAHNRRMRGMIGGTSITILGLGLAVACLNPDDLVLAWRYYLFGFSELMVIMGAVLGAGAWQGWLLPSALEEGDALSAALGRG